MKKILAILLSIGILIGSFTGCDGNNPSDPVSENSSESESQAISSEKNENSETITLVDNVGRSVELPYPVERCIVTNRYNNELIRACGAIDKVIATDMNTAQDREYWGNFSLDDVISKSNKEINYEKIVELNPQVVIMASNGGYEEAEKQLEPFGIKVFVISGYDTSDFKNQCENIGKMFNKEPEAQEFYNYFNDKINYIKTQLEGKEKRTLYLEQTSDYSTPMPGDYFYNMIEFACVENVFSTNLENINANEIDPEEVIARNPEYIIKVITSKEALSGTGVYAPPTKEEFQEAYQSIISRPGWSSIDAVKNNNIFFMTQFSHGGASKLVGSIYIAKWLYPDLLPDLDAEQVFRDWMVKFQGFKELDGHFYAASELK